jgi:ArsR family transcriptional regulator
MNKRSDETSKQDTSACCDIDAVDEQAVRDVLGALADERRVGMLAEVFSALGDPTRLRILAALGVRELCVCDLAAVIGASQSAVSHQLRTLRHLDLVSFRREGKRAVYFLADDHVRTLLQQGGDHVDERRGGHGG